MNICAARGAACSVGAGRGGNGANICAARGAACGVGAGVGAACVGRGVGAGG